MVESVQRFGEVLGNEAGRSVAIVADGHGAVGGLDPALVLFVHHMAVGAGRGIIRHVRMSPGIAEGEQTDAHQQTKGDSNQPREELTLVSH